MNSSCYWSALVAHVASSALSVTSRGSRGTGDSRGAFGSRDTSVEHALNGERVGAIAEVVRHRKIHSTLDATRPSR